MIRIHCQAGIAVGLVCLVAAAKGTASVEVSDTGNLLSNPSFEEVDARGRPSGWIMAVCGGLEWAIDRDVRHHGGQSIRITGSDVKEKWAGIRHSSPISLAPNRVYEISGWVKAQDVSFVADSGGPQVLWFHRHLPAQAKEEIIVPGL